MALERNPDHGKFVKPEGYKDLGYLGYINAGDPPEYLNCIKIHSHKQRRIFDNSLYMYRCTDEITICDECKIFWHVDMSD